MKIAYVYTVTRESEIKDEDLDREIEFYKGALKDETDEYLYDGASIGEKITVEMQIADKHGNWATIYGDPR